MKIKVVSVGPLSTNCYILEKDDECIIIDPGAEPLKIEGEINENLVGIIITHSHPDHIDGVDYFQHKYQVPVYNYSNLKEGINKINNFEFEIIYNPGHTRDSISIYFPLEKKMFVGDFIFYHTIGRIDLDGGNFDDMLASINKLKKYDDIVIYPGHGEITTLDEEKNNNIYFK